MQHRDMQALKAALRILRAVTERQHPDPGDVLELRSLFPWLTQSAPDELAREIVYRVIHSPRQRSSATN